MKKDTEEIKEPISRSNLRKNLGILYYAALRYILWLRLSKSFAKTVGPPLAYLHYSHETPLLRNLKGLDMQYQYNKITNLKIATQKIDGIIIRPGEILSYWKLIGRPTKKKGYLEGMILDGGKISTGIGGGLCQLSNLIYWSALHTPLTIIERHRHGYDVFPDSNRTLPFGSGATCFYPHRDLMIANHTKDDFQLNINITKETLEGKWHSSAPPLCRYEIIEKHHKMQSQFWGGYSRHNELYRRTYTLDDVFINEEFILSNSAIMMYAPFISEKSSCSP